VPGVTKLHLTSKEGEREVAVTVVAAPPPVQTAVLR